MQKMFLNNYINKTIYIELNEGFSINNYYTKIKYDSYNGYYLKLINTDDVGLWVEIPTYKIKCTKGVNDEGQSIIQYVQTIVLIKWSMIGNILIENFEDDFFYVTQLHEDVNVVYQMIKDGKPTASSSNIMKFSKMMDIINNGIIEIGKHKWKIQDYYYKNENGYGEEEFVLEMEESQ